MLLQHDDGQWSRFSVHQSICCSWEEFKGMMDEREPKMLRAFTSLEVNSAGGLEPKSIKGVPALLCAHYLRMQVPSKGL